MKMTEIVVRLKYLGDPSDSGPETNWTEFSTQKYSNDMYISYPESQIVPEIFSQMMDILGSEISQIVNNSRTSAIQSLPMRANDAARDSTIRHVFTFFTP